MGAEGDGRVSVEGPSILICPQYAQTIGVALHELATNSLKHGALSRQAGALNIRWSGTANIHWQMERNERLPEPAPEPVRKGFGHVVMVDMVERATNGKVELTFRPEGIVLAA